MNIIKNIIGKTTGYWIHKLSNLPIGTDLFVDIHHKLKYPALDIVFDVGANTGQSQNYFRFHEPGASIYSFEPVRAVYEQLVKNSAGKPAIVLEQLALGEQPGEKSIRLFEEEMTVLNSLRDDVMNNDANAVQERIRIDTLDQYCETRQLKKIDLLKIDTEGYEINVLQGALQMIGRGSIPFIYCEAGFQPSNKRNTYLPELTAFLLPHGYYFYGLYQVDHHDWARGNGLGNALFVHQSVYLR